MLETKTSQINQSLLQSSDSQDDKLSQQQNNLKEKQAPPGSQLLQSNSTDSSNLQYDFKFQDKKVTPTIKSILEVDYGPEEYRSSFIKSKCQVVIILQGYEEECIYLQNLETQEILSKVEMREGWDYFVSTFQDKYLLLRREEESSSDEENEKKDDDQDEDSDDDNDGSKDCFYLYNLDDFFFSQDKSKSFDNYIRKFYIGHTGYLQSTILDYNSKMLFQGNLPGDKIYYFFTYDFLKDIETNPNSKKTEICLKNEFEDQTQKASELIERFKESPLSLYQSYKCNIKFESLNFSGLFFIDKMKVMRSFHLNKVYIKTNGIIRIFDFEDSTFIELQKIHLDIDFVRDTNLLYLYDPATQGYELNRIDFDKENPSEYKVFVHGKINCLPNSKKIDAIHQLHQQILYIQSEQTLYMIDAVTYEIVNQVQIGRVENDAFYLFPTTQRIFKANSCGIIEIKPFYSSYHLKQCIKKTWSHTVDNIIRNNIITSYQYKDDCFNIQTYDLTIENPLFVQKYLKYPKVGDLQFFKFFYINDDEVIFYANQCIQIAKLADSLSDIPIAKRLWQVKHKPTDILPHPQHKDQVFVAIQSEIKLFQYDLSSDQNPCSIRSYQLKHKIDYGQFFISGQNFEINYAQTETGCFGSEEQFIINKVHDEFITVSFEHIQDKTRMIHHVFNKDYTVVYLMNLIEIMAFDLVSKQRFKTFSFPLSVQGQYENFALTFNDDKNQLVLYLSNFKTLILQIESTKDMQRVKHVIELDDIACTIKDSDQKRNVVMFDALTNRARYKRVNELNLLIPLDPLIGNTKEISKHKFEYFYNKAIHEQNINFDNLVVNCKKQSYSLNSDIDNQTIGYIEQLYTSEDFVSLFQLHYKTDLEIINYIQTEGNINKLLMYYPQIGNLINMVAKRPIVLDYLIKNFQLIQKSNLPILMLIVDGQSPLDAAIKANQINSVILLLDIIVKFQNNHSFNHLVDKNLITLIEKQINLAEYFESELPLIKINHKNFPDLHHDDQEIIVGVPNINHPKEILENYSLIFQDIIQNQASENDQQHPIEYFLVNLPETLTFQPQQLQKVLSEAESIELFEFLALQTIINFKWQRYTKGFFQTQFSIFLIFCFSFLFEILYSLILVDKAQDPPLDNRNIYVLYSSQAVSLSVLIYFFIYEIKQAMKQEGYFQEIWNFFDYTLSICYIVLISLEATLTPSHDSIVILKVSIVSLAFLKISFFLRIYDGFSFLVSMLAAVFVDLKYFIGFFVIFILQFGIIFAILFNATDIEEYNGISIFGYLMMAFRTSSGDFNVDSYKDQSQILVIFSWTIWVIAVMILNVMFMNFIIAVISESYEKVMQKMIAESYKVKVQMIVERELHFTEDELKQTDLFPKYLLLRRPVSSNQSDQGEKLVISNNRLA
eukprot:403335532